MLRVFVWHEPWWRLFWCYFPSPFIYFGLKALKISRHFNTKFTLFTANWGDNAVNQMGWLTNEPFSKLLAWLLYANTRSIGIILSASNFEIFWNAWENWACKWDEVQKVLYLVFYSFVCLFVLFFSLNFLIKSV